MKKILVVLLILAVTAGAFAQQGTWTIGADGRVATALNFHNNEGGNYSDYSTAQLFQNSYGQLTLGYTKGAISTSLVFTTNKAKDSVPNTAWDNASIIGSFKVNGTSDAGLAYQVNAGVNLIDFIYTRSTGTPPDGANSSAINIIDSLWGSFEFLNKVLYVEAAAKGGSGKTWTANNAVDRDVASRINSGDRLASGVENALLFNLSFNNIFEFGIYINDLFAPFYPARTHDAAQGGAYLIKHPDGETSGANDVTIINSIVAGAKFNISPFTVAAQFSTRDYNTYLGVTYDQGPINAGVSFWGAFPDNNNVASTAIRTGGDVTFKGGFFGVKIAAVLGLYKDAITEDNTKSTGWYGDSTTYATTLELSPTIWVDPLPSYLKFTLKAGFNFKTQRDGDKVTDVTWKINPIATWNFLGTGCGTNTADGTWNIGFKIEYLFESSATATDKVGNNNLRLGFSWKI